MRAKDIQWHLATRKSSPFYLRTHLCVVPNVSWGLIDHEADLLAMSKTGYLTEVEIKVSFADWKADLAKRKWKSAKWSGKYQSGMIKRFYYAAPAALAVRHAELEIPDFAGVVSVSDLGIATIIKPAKNITGHRKLSLLETHKLLRLAAIKAWRMAYKPGKEAKEKIHCEHCGVHQWREES